MLLFRWIKRESFMNKEVRKYFLYAVGEILLVIAGIVIALQIDTWYEGNKQQERLDSYLENISHNINDDMNRLQQLKSNRAKITFESISALTGIVISYSDVNEFYNAVFASSANAAIQSAQKKLYLIANTGSYRALESSGLISELSDTKIETMLYDYYRTVDRIANIEQDMNNIIRELTLKFQTETESQLPPIIVREPLIAWNLTDTESDETAKKVQQLYLKKLQQPLTASLLRSTVNQSLMREYERLLSLGSHLTMLINNELDDLKVSQMDVDIYSSDSPSGHPVLVENGRLGYHSYGLFTAPSDGIYRGFETVYNSIWLKDNALNVQYSGGQPWVFLYFKYGPSALVFERFSKDYSMYDRIQLELKREASTECLALKLEVKDIDDAEKAGLVIVPLNLTPEWQTYTVALADFVEADLTRLNVVAGFLIDSQEPCSFAIRDIRYLKPE